MDLVDLIEEKKFLGLDFLTWLCFASETGAASFELNEQSIEILMDFNMTLSCDREQGCNKIAFSGTATPGQQTLPEIKSAIKSGKKISDVKILMIVGEMEFSFKISATLLEITSLKLPKTGNSDYEDEIAGAALERIYLGNTAKKAVDHIFKKFIELRNSKSAWENQLSGMRDWLQEN